MCIRDRHPGGRTGSRAARAAPGRPLPRGAGRGVPQVVRPAARHAGRGRAADRCPSDPVVVERRDAHGARERARPAGRQGSGADVTDLDSAVWPMGVTRAAGGVLAVGGVDARALAAEYGTPAWVVDETDFRARAAAFRLSLIHISEPTRLGMISYAVFCLK